MPKRHKTISRDREKKAKGKSRTTLVAHLFTIWSDLPSCAVGGHARLRGSLVGSVLQPDHVLSGLEGALVELALVGAGQADAQGRAGEADLLGLMKGTLTIDCINYSIL